MDIEKEWIEEIQAELRTIKGMEVGSEPYKAAVDGVTKLMDRSIEMKKVEIERDDKERKMKADKIDMIVRNSVAAAGIVLPIIVTIWGTKASFKFEEEGTITTIMGRGFINKLLPKK